MRDYHARSEQPWTAYIIINSIKYYKLWKEAGSYVTFRLLVTQDFRDCCGLRSRSRFLSKQDFRDFCGQHQDFHQYEFWFTILLQSFSCHYFTCIRATDESRHDSNNFVIIVANDHHFGKVICECKIKNFYVFNRNYLDVLVLNIWNLFFCSPKLCTVPRTITCLVNSPLSLHLFPLFPPPPFSLILILAWSYSFGAVPASFFVLRLLVPKQY